MSMSMPSEPFWIETEDWHTGGEPFRIVSKLPPWAVPPGSNVPERRVAALVHPLNTLREALVHEPRGHADMYGGFLVPPSPGADVGVLFFHKDGFSTACGHGTIALGLWAVRHGIVPVPSHDDGTVDVTIDVPSGRVIARVRVRGGKAVDAEFINVPSYPLAAGVVVSIPADAPSAGSAALGSEDSAQSVSVDLVYGGAVYAVCPAAAVGVTVVPAGIDRAIRKGRDIKAAVRVATGKDIYGTIFVEDHSRGDAEPGVLRQTNVVIFADGQVDRSPCGSGTAARVAQLTAQGALRPGHKLIHTSIVGSVFEAWAEHVDTAAAGTTVPCVRGSAHLVGVMRFYLDPSAPLFPGFVLR